MKSMNELVARYFYDPSVEYGIYDVFACYDSMEDYDNRKVSFYDVYNSSGICENEGDPFYSMPTWQDIFDYYWKPSAIESVYEHPRDTKS